MATQEGDSVRQFAIDADVKEGLATIIDLSNKPQALKTLVENLKAAKEASGTDADITAAWNKVDANPLHAAIVEAVIAQPKQRGEMEKAIVRIVEGHGHDAEEVHRLLTGVDRNDSTSLQTLQAALETSIGAALGEKPVAMTAMGNAIRQMNLDPKVREGLATIAEASDSLPGFAGKLKTELDIEVALVHARSERDPESEKAALARLALGNREGLSPVEGKILLAVQARDSAHLEQVEKALDKIVESQGLKPAEVHKLVEQLSQSDPNAYKTLRDAVKGGIDSAIQAPLQPPGQRQNGAMQR